MRSIKVYLPDKIYPLEAVLNACYTFIDKAYLFLDYNSTTKKVIISIRPKRRISKKQTELMRMEFQNKLLHSALRHTLSKNNKKIREYIISRGLFSFLPETELLSLDDKTLDYQDDPLGIGIPWEEKYKKDATAKV